MGQIDNNYTHFALSKINNKIVNGWDYNGYDNSELRQFKKDYFLVDLIDYEINPKDITILTKAALMRKGIDPSDDSNWANTVDEDIAFTNYCGRMLKECKKIKIKEIKHFHPNGKSEPNGIGLQRAGYFKECVDNFNSFILNEDVHPEQYGLADYRGGVIVFATSVNAVQLDKNAFINKIKQAIATFKNSAFKSNIIKKIIDKFNTNKQTEDFIGAYSVGNFFKGKYLGDSGEHFDDTSLAVEINGLSSKGLMLLAAYFARVFKQETVLVKDFNQNKIFLANGHNTGNNDFSKINKKSVDEDVTVETSRAQKAANVIKGKTDNPNRIVKTFAILSPENPMGKQLSNSENNQRTQELLMKLSIGHYRYFKVKGQYGNKENSVIIYNIGLDDALYLGDEYNQESIIWCELNFDENSENNGISYQYWERDGEGNPLRKTIEKDRFIDAQDFDDFFTQVTRGFKFQIPFFEHYKNICNVINERNIKDAEKLIKESLDNTFTKKHQWIVRGKMNGRQGNIVYAKNDKGYLTEDIERSQYI